MRLTKNIKMKKYYDRMCKAEESNLMVGNIELLLKQPQANKSTTQFESQPYELTDKSGNGVVIKS